MKMNSLHHYSFPFTKIYERHRREGIKGNSSAVNVKITRGPVTGTDLHGNGGVDLYYCYWTAGRQMSGLYQARANGSCIRRVWTPFPRQNSHRDKTNAITNRPYTVCQDASQWTTHFSPNSRKIDDLTEKKKIDQA